MNVWAVPRGVVITVGTVGLLSGVLTGIIQIKQIFSPDYYSYSAYPDTLSGIQMIIKEYGIANCAYFLFKSRNVTHRPFTLRDINNECLYPSPQLSPKNLDGCEG